MQSFSDCIFVSQFDEIDDSNTNDVLPLDSSEVTDVDVNSDYIGMVILII